MKIRWFLVGALLLLTLVALLAWVAFKPPRLIGAQVRPSMVPPPLVVRLTRTNVALRIFPGVAGALIGLPDGSLWSWGQRGK